MARRLRLSPAAVLDRDAIWLYSANRYGFDHADAYDRLVGQALQDLASDPLRLTTRSRPEFGPDVRSYHIASSVKRSGSHIGKPRHIVFYTVEFVDTTYVMRILKDDMDPHRHLTP